jgi:hypothetical protein
VITDVQYYAEGRGEVGDKIAVEVSVDDFSTSALLSVFTFTWTTAETQGFKSGEQHFLSGFVVPANGQLKSNIVGGYVVGSGSSISNRETWVSAYLD